MFGVVVNSVNDINSSSKTGLNLKGLNQASFAEKHNGRNAGGGQTCNRKTAVSVRG